MDAVGTAEFVDDLLGDVAEDAMADVVQEGRGLHDGAVLSAESQALAQAAGDVTDADGVLKAGVQRPGVNEMGHRQLAHASQPLEDRRVHGTPLVPGEADHAVDGIADDAG